MILALGIAGAVWVTRLIHEGVERRGCIRRADASMPGGVHSVQFRGLTVDADRKLGVSFFQMTFQRHKPHGEFPKEMRCKDRVKLLQKSAWRL